MTPAAGWPAARAALAALLLVLVASACARPEAPRRIVAEEEMLRRQIDGLKGLLARAETGSLVPDDKLLVVVSEELAQEIVALGLPREVPVAGRIRVRAETAEVRFRDNVASVRVDAQVRSLDPGLQEVVVRLRVYGALDRVTLDSASGVLRGKVALMAFEVADVQGGGANATLRDLIERMGRDNLDEFQALLPSLEIPVRLQEDVVMRGFGSDAVIAIAPARVPLRMEVARVMAADRRLFVVMDAQVGAWARLPPEKQALR